MNGAVGQEQTRGAGPRLESPRPGSPRPTPTPYTVEEPTDGISERSASVDDGEGSVGSWDDLAQYMRHLVSHREKIDKELANYQAGVRELRQACERPLSELGDIQSQHARLSDQASSLQRSKQELVSDLTINTLLVDNIDKSVGSLRQLVEDAVETIQNAQSMLAAHPNTPTPSTSPPRFRDSAEFRPDASTEIQSCLDKCKQHVSLHASHKQWVIGQAEQVRERHGKLKALLLASGRRLLPSVDDVAEAVVRYSEGADGELDAVAEVPMRVLITYLDKVGRARAREATAPIQDRGSSPKPISQLHTAPARSARAAVSGGAARRPKTPRRGEKEKELRIASHRLRISPDGSPHSRRSYEMQGSPTGARRSSGDSAGSRRTVHVIGITGAAFALQPRYAPADYSHVPSRVGAPTRRSGARSLTPSARTAARAATSRTAGRAPPSPTASSQSGAEHSVVGSTSGTRSRRTTTRSSIERLAQPKRPLAPEYPWKGRNAPPAAAGARRRATTTSPPPPQEPSARARPAHGARNPLTGRSKGLKPVGAVAGRAKGATDAEARPPRLSLPSAGLESYESGMSYQDVHSLATGDSFVSDVGSEGTLPLHGSFASTAPADEAPGRAALQLSPGETCTSPPPPDQSELSTPDTVHGDAAPAPPSPSHTTVSAGYGMVGFSGERESPATSGTRTDADSPAPGGAPRPPRGAGGGPLHAGRGAAEGVRGRAAGPSEAAPGRAVSPHLPSVPAGASDSDQLKLNLAGVHGVNGSGSGRSTAVDGDGAVQAWLSQDLDGAAEPGEQDFKSSERTEASAVLGRASFQSRADFADDTPRVDWNGENGRSSAHGGDRLPDDSGRPASDASSSESSPVRVSAAGRSLHRPARAAVHVLGAFPGTKLPTGDAAATRADGHSGLPAVPEEDDAAALAASARASRLPGKGISRARDNFRWLNSGGGQKENVSWNPSGRSDADQGKSASEAGPAVRQGT